MASEAYVVHHHGAWRTRIEGKHCGEYPSREAAVRSAVARAEETGQDTRVFSQGKVCQFRFEWRSGGQPETPSGSHAFRGSEVDLAPMLPAT
jgi:hypothetical protein